MDVELGSALSYAEAEAIVLAIHRRSLLGAPGQDLERYIENLDASSNSSIRTIDPIAREFSVSIDHGGSGYFLSVRLLDGAVILYELGMWLA